MVLSSTWDVSVSFMTSRSDVFFGPHTRAFTVAKHDANGDGAADLMGSYGNSQLKDTQVDGGQLATDQEVSRRD